MDDNSKIHALEEKEFSKEKCIRWLKQFQNLGDAPRRDLLPSIQGLTEVINIVEPHSLIMPRQAKRNTDALYQWIWDNREILGKYLEHDTIVIEKEIPPTERPNARKKKVVSE